MTTFLIDRLPMLALVAASALPFSAPASAAQELNLYTYREAGLIKPLLDEFTKEHRASGSTRSSPRAGSRSACAAEGQNSPADVLLTVDIGRLQQAEGLRRHPAGPKSEALEKTIPAALPRPEGHWYGVSSRGRVVYASKDRVAQDAITYEELADPKWKGKICIRSGQHLYNIASSPPWSPSKGEAEGGGMAEGAQGEPRQEALRRRPRAGQGHPRRRLRHRRSATPIMSA